MTPTSLAPPSSPALGPLLRLRPAVSSSRIRELLHLVDRPGMLSMAGGLPAAAALDVARVRAAAMRSLDRTGPMGPEALQYGPTEGLGVLRELLADRHGVDTDQVLVTTGSQQALDLLARALCEPGDPVVVEAPSYLGALQSFAAAGAEVVALGGDADGFDVDELHRALAEGLRPRLAYVVPNFHNPSGAVLSADRRRTLAALADQYRFIVVEDDPYGELRYTGAPLASMATWSPLVVRVGSSSKTLAPGLRVGWMVGHPEVIEAASRIKQAADLHTSALDQLIVADLLGDEAEHRRHLAALQALYRTRAQALGDALDRHLGDRVHHLPVSGGMFTWVQATDGIDADALLVRALAHGVAFVPGSAFSTDPDRFRCALRLSFATLDPADLDRAVARLSHVWTG